MKRLKSCCFFILVVLVASSVAAMASSTGNGDVVIYNSGQAQVDEIRTVTLPRGPANVVIKDVPVTLDATSVRATAKGMTVKGVQYRYEPATEKNLLQRYVGKELTILMPDPSGGEGHVPRKATVVANNGRPLFLLEEGVYSGDYSGLLFPELPKGIQESPSLTLDTHNASPGKRDIRLSYLISGLSWRADYTLAVNKEATSAFLNGWATVKNGIDHGFTNTGVTLVAGNVRRARPAQMKSVGRSYAMEADMVMSAPPVREGNVSEYHTYSVNQRVDIAGNSTRQLQLFTAPKVGVKLQLVSRYHGAGNIRQSGVKQGVESRLLFKNTKKNGLGRAIPAGIVRVSMPGTSGKLILVGEPTIPHVGNGGEVELTLGQSFDVSVKRHKAAYKKLGKQSFEISWRFEIINGKEQKQALTLQDSFSGDWSVVTASHPHTIPDGETLQFDLMIPPSKEGKPTVVTYTAQVSY